MKILVDNHEQMSHTSKLPERILIQYHHFPKFKKKGAKAKNAKTR